ncbi:hypothetical protein ACHAXM_005022, partial [Skeletonema potamos]
MSIRPSNISHSQTPNRKAISKTSPQASTPYLLSEAGSDGDDSDFSFEIEEEIVQSPKKKIIDTKKKKKETIKQQDINSSQPKSSKPILSRAVQSSLKSKVEQKSSKVATSSSNKAVAYTALSVQKNDHDDMSFEESIISDDDFSISVASETNGLVGNVKSSSSNANKRAVEVGSRDSVEHFDRPLTSRRGYACDNASTTSSKTAIQSLMEKLSSMGDKSDNRNSSSRPTFVTATQKPLQPDTTFTSSSKVQSLKSKAAGSIDFAQSIVRLHGDIESGASTAVSTSCSSSMLWKHGTMEGQKLMTPNPKPKQSPRRKLCCIVGCVLVAAAGTVGALIALDVILKEKFAPSSETPDTATPTKSESNFPWYVDWDTFHCVMDCDGRPPCGGTKMNDDETFPSLKQCCLEGMGSFIDENWTLDICMEMTAVDTVIPTFSPTPEKKEEKEKEAPTIAPQVSTPYPTKPSEPIYVADFSEMKCIAKNKSRKAQWEKGYEKISDCCDANFGGDLYKECLGEADSGTETLTLYYPDYGERNCVEEYVSTKQIWDKGFDTKDECCEVKFNWDKSSACFRGNEVIAISTPIVTKAPTYTISDSPSTMPSSSPTKAPTFHPTLKPTTSPPTRAPTR